MLEFHIDASRPQGHRLGVRLSASTGAVRVAIPDAAGESAGSAIDFFLPTWTPGSYLIREYARHLSRVEARDGTSGRELSCRKIGKNRFRVEADGATRIELNYSVYAHELSVRTADVDAGHAFWNHACVLLWPVGRPDIDAHITVDYPSRWTVACSLARAQGVPAPSRDHATVTLHAADLDTALDAPVLIGELRRFDWTIAGVPHAIVLDGLGGIEPPSSLVEDLTRIVHCAAAVFDGVLPYTQYIFMAMFTAEGHGGLEHRDCSTLLMSRTALTNERSYREFSSLAAHELFHAWNVKRMRPTEFWRYDYERENYTSLLWLMEGWTAYYDDLIVTRAGLMSPGDYLAAMTKNVQAMLSAPGRLRLSLEESSFDAWIRLYRPDENTRNSSQNYYGNGAVAALCLDLLIRRATRGARCLDNVLRGLYQKTFDDQRGYDMQDVEQVLAEVAEHQVVDELRNLVRGPLDPALSVLLADVGVKLEHADAGRPSLGVVFRAGSTFVSSVVDGDAAAMAGLAPGDEILAIGGLRATGDRWQELFRSVAKIGEPLQILVDRRGAIANLTAYPAAATNMVKLVLDETASEEQVANRHAWLSSNRQLQDSRPNWATGSELGH